MGKLKPHVTNWGLQKQALKWSLGFKMFTKDQHLSKEEGGSRTGQREMSACCCQPGKTLAKPLESSGINTVHGSHPTSG